MGRRRDSRVPWEFAGIAGLVGALVLGVLCAAVAPGRLTGGLVAFAVFVAVLGWFTTPIGGGLVALLGWLCLTGFVVNADGTLHATGPADLLRAVVLAAAGLGAAWAHALLRPRVAGEPRQPEADPFVPRLRPGDRPFGVVHGMSLGPTRVRRPAGVAPPVRPDLRVAADPDSPADPGAAPARRAPATGPAPRARTAPDLDPPGGTGSRRQAGVGPDLGPPGR